MNWCWVFAIHLVSALDVTIGEVVLREECVFMRSFGWAGSETGDLKGVVIVAEGLLRRLVLLIIMLLAIGRLNGCQRELIDRLPLAWYTRDNAAAELWLAERCITVDSLAIYVMGWPVSTVQASTVVGALLAWALGEVLARWLFD